MDFDTFLFKFTDKFKENGRMAVTSNSIRILLLNQFKIFLEYNITYPFISNVWILGLVGRQTDRQNDGMTNYCHFNNILVIKKKINCKFISEL